MKLSEMNVKQLSAALCQLAAPMARIAKDESLNSLFAEIGKKVQSREILTNFNKMGMLLEAVPVLLESHYADTIRIMAIMTGRTDAEVEELNGMDMIDEMMKCIDDQFLRFFRSSAVTEPMKTDKSE